jgi:hypothetical protein
MPDRAGGQARQLPENQAEKASKFPKITGHLCLEIACVRFAARLPELDEIKGLNI